MPEGEFITAALGQSVIFYPREEATIQAELRATMVVRLPAGVIFGALPGIDLS